MNHPKNIEPKNDKGQPHGFWKQYFSNGQLWSKGNWVNDEKHGYWEWYHDGDMYMKEYCII